jgi:hypothetical protein
VSTGTSRGHGTNPGTGEAVGPGAQAEGPGAAATEAGGTGGLAGSPCAAGRLLGRLSVLPALLVMAWLLAGLPLLLAGAFTPVLMLMVSVPLAVAIVLAGLRWLPDRWPGWLGGSGPDGTRAPWWSVAGVLAVAVAFGAHQLAYHSQQIIVLRDPAAYFQFGFWIAHHGSLPIPSARAAFGGAHPGLTFASAAFYQVGGVVVPQFMAGLPMILAAGFWSGGLNGALVLAPLLGAGAVLTFGGFAARLAGPRWAPLAALVLAISLPEQFTSRSNYSEPLVQILFLGGLCLVIDSLAAGRPGARVTAALGGLALGLTLLVRIDGASDILPVIPYCGLLLIGRRPQAVPLLAGLAVGGLCGSIDGLVLTRPYLAAIKDSLIPLALVGALVVVATAVAVVVLRRRGLPDVRGTWLPGAGAALAVAIVAGFTVRPYLQTVRGHTHPSFIGRYQRVEHLPVDPARQYSEISLHWVFWYIGLPAVLLATFGAALLARRCLRGGAPAWTLPLLTFGWTIVTTLYRPAILPDHPWASRRLVPAVLPGFILLAIWACNWLTCWVRQHGYDRVIRAGLVSACTVALVVPAAITTLGLSVAHGGPLGIRPVASGMALRSTYSGEIAAVNRLCAAIPGNASVVIIDHETMHLTQDIRAMCGLPVADMAPAPAAVMRVVRGIEQAGRRPVILSGHRVLLAPYGAPAREIMRLRSTQDPHSLMAPPVRPWPLRMQVWMSLPGR